MSEMYSRRDFIKIIIASGLILSGCTRQNVTQQTNNSLMQVFGLQKDKARFSHLYAAGPPAEVLLYSLAPERLLGWTTQKSSLALSYLVESTHKLPFLGSINGRGSTVSFELLIQEKVDLVIDVGVVNDTYTSSAKRISSQLNVPVVLIDSRLATSVEQIIQLGELISSPYTEILANAAKQALEFAHYSASNGQNINKIYYARGADGLETGMKNSIHTEVFSLLGALNMGDTLGEGGLAKVSVEQILQWNPDIIVTQDENFYHSVYQKSIWANLPAVRQKQVYLLPKIPFGWVDGPPSINRLLGIYILEPILKGQAPNKNISEIKNLYQTMYHKELTISQLNQLGLG